MDDNGLICEEWAYTIPKSIMHKWFFNRKKYGPNSKLCLRRARFINYGFIWSGTSENVEYWNAIAGKITRDEI